MDDCLNRGQFEAQEGYISGLGSVECWSVSCFDVFATCLNAWINIFMTAESLVRLLEEMMELKIRSSVVPAHLKLTPDLSRMLQDKRETDRHRLEQIRSELVRFLSS